MMKAYRKKTVQFMRPYLVGEDLTNISVPKEHIANKGDMIAFDEHNPTDVCLIPKEFFDNNYVEVVESERAEV